MFSNYNMLTIDQLARLKLQHAYITAHILTTQPNGEAQTATDLLKSALGKHAAV